MRGMLLPRQGSEDVVYKNHCIKVRVSLCGMSLSICGFLEPRQNELSQETVKGRPAMT